MIHRFQYDTEIGPIGIAEGDGALVAIDFGGSVQNQDPFRETPVLREAIQQIRGYLAGVRKDFQLPIKLLGTDFQRRVWQGLQQIPYGETRSYKELAESIDRPTACRAVGMANNKNPLPLIIPCHRVIGSDGKLVGYGGGLEIKRALLKIESLGGEVGPR